MPPPDQSGKLRLTRREASPIPLEVDGITPERIASLSVSEIARLPVFHGNRKEELGQHFDVSGDPAGGWVQFTGDTRTVKSIGAGMTTGTVSVEHHAGAHAGAGMTGGRLAVGGNAGDWLGAEMRGGLIEVGGSAGDQVGAAYRGSRRGMTGGVILCRGEAGGEAGLMMRGGTIIVQGACGEFAGASMIAGSLFVFGRAGNWAGAGMKRGTIFAGGVHELPPSFRYSCEFRPTFLPLYLRSLGNLLTAVPLPVVRGSVRCHRGDLLHGGRGELLIATGR